MDNIVLLDENNVVVDADVIRYFKYNNNYYLIFTFGEKDEKGYQKLYIVQILEELGEKITRNISDDEEWHEIQSMVKDSIRQIKKGNDNDVEKLNVYDLNNIRIEKPRFFKLDPKLVNILETDIVDDIDPNSEEGDSNMEINNELNTVQPVHNTENTLENNNLSTNAINPVVEDVDYKELYFLLKQDRDALEVVMEDLLKKLIKYKDKYGELEEE